MSTINIADTKKSHEVGDETTRVNENDTRNPRQITSVATSHDEKTQLKSPLPPAPSSQSLQFTSSSITLVATLVRLGFVLLPCILDLSVPTTSGASLISQMRLVWQSSDLCDWLYHSRALASVLVDPFWTMHPVREATALRTLVSLSSRDPLSAYVTAENYRASFKDVYRITSGPAQVHLPPLALAFFEALSHSSSRLLVVTTNQTNVNNDIIRGFFLILADFIIAFLLEQLARNSIGSSIISENSKEEENEELVLEKKMPLSIQPERAYLFDTQSCFVGENRVQTSDNQPSVISLPPPLVTREDLPLFVALFYYASPVTIVASTCLGCAQNCQVALILFALWQGSISRGSVVLAAWALAVAVYFDVRMVVYLLPVAASKLFRPHHRIEETQKILPLIVAFIATTLSLQWLSFLLVGPQLYLSVVWGTHGYVTQLSGLAPSLSILWYFSMEIFSRFSSYFSIMINGLPFLLVGPVASRLYRFPLAMTAVYWLLFTFFRPTTTLFDLSVGLCLILLSPRSVARMRVTASLVALCAVPVVVLLYLTAHVMWLENGSGEANYLYFQCLAYNIFVAILMLGFCGASVRREKALRLMEKEQIQSTSVSADVDKT